MRRARRWPGAVVGDLDRYRVARAGDGHLGVRRAGVLEDVGQCLLDDAVGGHAYGRGQSRVVVGVDDQVYGQAGPADAVGQRGQVADARLRGEPGLLVRIAQDAEQAAHLGQCLPPAVLDLFQGRRGRASRRLGRGGLQDHDAEMMGDDVVQLAGDPGALGGDCLPGLLPQCRGTPAGTDDYADQPAGQDLAGEEQASRMPGPGPGPVDG